MLIFVFIVFPHFIKVLEKYQVYGDSVLQRYGLGPSLRDIVKVGTDKYNLLVDFHACKISNSN